MLCCLGAAELTVGPYSVSLLQDGDRYLGIGAVAGDWSLRDQNCPPWLLATMSQDGVSYQDWQLQDIDQTDDGITRISLGSTGQASLLQLRQNVYGHAYMVGVEQTHDRAVATATVELRSDQYAGLPRLTFATRFQLITARLNGCSIATAGSLLMAGNGATRRNAGAVNLVAGMLP